MLLFSPPASMPEPFTRTPNAALADPRLSPTAKTVLSLAIGWNPRQFDQFSAAEVSRRLGGSAAQAGLSAIQAAFKRLESAGYLTRTRRGPTWVYVLHPFAASPAAPGRPAAQVQADTSSELPSDFPPSTPDNPASPSEPTAEYHGSQTTDFPRPNTQEDSKIPSSPPPDTTPVTVTEQEQQEEEAHLEESASPEPDVDARGWLAEVSARLPLGARPTAFTADLVAQARRWADLDPQLVAAALAPTYPYPVVSPAGLLLKKLRELDVSAVQEAGARAAAHAAAQPPALAAEDAADAESVAAYVAQVRASLASDGASREPTLPGGDSPSSSGPRGHASRRARSSVRVRAS